mgnify:CR=1 FL=1
MFCDQSYTCQHHYSTQSEKEMMIECQNQSTAMVRARARTHNSDVIILRGPADGFRHYYDIHCITQYIFHVFTCSNSTCDQSLL